MRLNIACDEFYRKFECINSKEDIWINTSSKEEVRLIIEFDEYVVVEYK